MAKTDLGRPISLRLTPKTHKRLVLQSKKLNLTLSGYLRYVIERLNYKGELPNDLYSL